MKEKQFIQKLTNSLLHLPHTGFQHAGPERGWLEVSPNRLSLPPPCTVFILILLTVQRQLLKTPDANSEWQQHTDGSGHDFHNGVDSRMCRGKTPPGWRMTSHSAKPTTARFSFFLSFLKVLKYMETTCS